MKEKINVLIADDHQMFLDGLKLIFTGIPNINIVAQAKSGIEVIDAFREYQIDLAILDLNMPKPNGFETCQIIKQNSFIKFSSVYIVKIIILHAG